MKTNLVKEYQENQKELSVIYGDLKEARKTKEDENWKITVECRDKQHKLESIRHKKEAKINKAYDKMSAQTDKQAKGLRSPISEVRRILDLLKVDQRKIEMPDNSVEYYDRYNDKNKRPVEWLKTLYKDEYFIIRLFIVQNDKPVNKFSLVAYGKSIFGEKIIKLPYSYGLNTKDDHGINLKYLIREASTTDELKSYLLKNGGNLLTDTLKEYKQLKKEYGAVINDHKVEDFKELFEVNCKKCGFFLLEKKSYSYSTNDQGKILCPDCKEVL